MGILGQLGGRKFLMAILGVVAMGLHNKFGMSSDAVMTIGGIICAYIFGQSFSDGMTGGITSTSTPVTSPTEVARINAAAEAAKMGTAMADNGDAAQDVSAAIDKLNK